MKHWFTVGLIWMSAGLMSVARGGTFTAEYGSAAYNTNYPTTDQYTLAVPGYFRWGEFDYDRFNQGCYEYGEGSIKTMLQAGAQWMCVAEARQTHATTRYAVEEAMGFLGLMLPFGVQEATVDLGDRVEFDQVGTSLEFRAYGFGADSAYDGLYIGDAFTVDGVDDIQIYGSVAYSNPGSTPVTNEPPATNYAWTTNDMQSLLDELPAGAVHQHVMMPMRDGTRLSTHYFLPGGFTSNSYPVVLLRSAYNYWPDMNRYIDDIVDQSDTNNFAYRNTNGYVYVIQNLRGDGDSETNALFEPRLSLNEINDAYDAVETIASNSWCNGRVGMYGGSGHGMAAYMGWFSKAPHLTVCAPGNTAPSLYQGWSFENGVRRWIYDWLSNRKADTPDWPKPTLCDYTTPSEWPAALRAGVVSNTTILIHDSDVWHNFFLDSTFNVFRAMTDDNKGYMVMGAGTHQGDVGLDFPVPPGVRTKLYLPKFLEVLDGATLTNRMYLQYYVMGDVRRADAEGNIIRETGRWPPPAVNTPWYLHADGSLSTTPPVSATDELSYSYHPTNPVPTVGGNYSYGFTDLSGPLDQLVPELTNRNDILRFETAPFSEAVEITGCLEAKLFVSTDVEDTTFMVKLIDIYPAEGTNAEYQAIMRESAIMGRYRDSLMVPAPMSSGVVYQLDIDMSSISLMVETNHRLAVHITSSSDPAFEVHPNTWSQVKDYASSPTAHNTLYLNTNFLSCIILPYYTTNAPTVQVSTNALNVPESGSASFEVYMSGPALSAVTVAVERASGDADLAVSSGASLVFTPATWTAPQQVTIAAASDADADVGAAIFELTGSGLVSASITAYEADSDLGLVLSPATLSVPEGGRNAIALSLTSMPDNTVTVSVAKVSGDVDLSVSGSAVFLFSPINWDQSQSVTIAAAEDVDQNEGVAVFSCTSPDVIDAQFLATESENDYNLVAAGLLAAWDLDSVTTAEAVLETNAWFMATGLVQNSSVGVLRHQDPYKQKITANSVAAINGDDATIVEALANESYFKWSLQPEAGYRLTVTSVVFRTENHLPMMASLLTDLSGTNVLAENASGLQVGQADLSGQAVFESLSGPIEFRLVGYGADGLYDRLVVGKAYASGDGDDIQVYGLIEAVGGEVAVEAATNQVVVPEGGVFPFDLRLSADPSGVVTVLTTRVSGDADLSVSSGGALVFSSANWNFWQTVMLSAAEDSDFEDGQATFLLSGPGLQPKNVSVTELDNDPVDSDYDDLPDDWEALYFGGPTNATPQALSANGVNTVIEAYLAGLNPVDASDFFTFTGAKTSSDFTILQWKAVTGRVYTIYGTTNLMNDFQVLQAQFTSGTFTDSYHIATASVFYRITATLAE